MYECYNSRVNTSLKFDKNIKSICECDMMEENETPLEYKENSVNLMFKPYEIKTIKVTF